MRYTLKVKSINKWDGPTGVDVEFIKILKIIYNI